MAENVVVTFSIVIMFLIITLMYGCKAFVGPQGPPGQTGSIGVVGPQGIPGIQGIPGASNDCNVTQQPQGALIRCTDGTMAIVTNGLDGTPGTVIQPIQFCDPTFASQYPGTFAEIGFCIAGNLYGVYSANDGFLSELPPGQYVSQGINSTCTFQIKPNCVVTW